MKVTTKAFVREVKTSIGQSGRINSKDLIPFINKKVEVTVRTIEDDDE